MKSRVAGTKRVFIGTKLQWISIVFVLPALLLNLIFYIYPLVQSLILSFYDVPMLGDKMFTGLENYRQLFQDAAFWKALRFTFLYILIVTPPLFLLGLALALLVNARLPLITFFRSVYFLPVIISMVSCSLVWLWAYNDVYGLVNYYLMELHLIDKPVVWMAEAGTSLPAITFMVTWKVAGFTMIILLSALQSIPSDIYEASKIDGANRWKTILYITLPILKPAIVLALVVSVIGSALAFEQFVIMTQGGPSNSTTTIVNLIYDTSFKYYKFGYGSAMTIVLLLILLLLSAIQVKVLSRN
ncbi:carbohydrate ABC transporter permease [Paenibacillus piri]|uniref:Sugar ABC transporter permease n=1 Tax=Paenibacillus piri TaxID=2547395 RepID=A0A4R5K7M6_9BACL|nr:sugar ABC transporter permease [Paenibacillus piri]TDF88566.1 sugar ABC transporter permease [Paenibacillus piri]